MTKVLPPGGEEEIKATLNTRNLKGKIQKTIRIYSNDPSKSQITLILKGEVTREVYVIPRALNFGTLGKGQTSSKDLTIRVEKPDNIRISKITIDDKMFSVESKGSNGEGTSRYEVKFIGSEKIGKISATIRIELEGVQPSVKMVPVDVRVEKDLRYPTRLYFVQRNGSYPSREVYFVTLSGTPVNIIKVEDTGGLLQTSILNRHGSASVLKTMVANPKAVSSSGTNYKLIITTDHKEEPKVEIYYSLVIPRRR